MRQGALGTMLVAAGLLLAPAAHAAFPGANGEIAYVTTRSTVAEGPVQVDPAHLFAIQPDGRGERPLHTGWRVPAWSFGDQGPAWSPDGRRVAFASDEETGLGYPAIYVMNADGSGERRLTPLLRTAVSPSWSPDGRRILYAVAQRSQEVRYVRWELYVVDADGGPERRLTRLESPVELDGVWSPDGRRIALAFGEHRYDIGVLDADGAGPPVNLTRSPEAIEVSPEWSPDGRKIAYDAITLGERPVRWDVWVMNDDGSARIELTRGLGEGAVTPAWSPDGSRLAFSALVGRNQDIYSMDLATRAIQRVTTHPAVETRPDWQALPPAPAAVPDVPRPLRIVVRGLPRGCARRGFAVRASAPGANRLGVTLDGRRIRSADRSRLAVRIPAGRLRAGRHRLRFEAEDATGRRAARTVAFRRCR